ncbi:MAG: DNA polymerase III subunit delta', partial [Methylocella sp.]
SFTCFGHAETKRQLFLAYLAGQLPQAFIIGGPPGIGKATLAWRLARFLLANPDPSTIAGEARADLFVAPGHPVSRQIAAKAHPDLVLLRREWNEKDKRFFTEIRVEDVRRVIHMFQQAAGMGGYRICILDCAEDLNPSSANALLKLIEEPPPRSLFLIVAHRPGQMLATLRSRCQKIVLKPLAAADIAQFVAALGPPWSKVDEAKLAAAIARAHGSVHNVLRLLDDRGNEFDSNLGRMLDDLPRIDWSKVHALAGLVAARDQAKDFETMLAAIDDWLDTRVRQGAQSPGANCARLAPYALVWEKLSEAAREIKTFNLDKRPFVLSLFADLAAAARDTSL